METSYSYRQCLMHAEEKLAAAGIEEAAGDAWLLFSEVFQMSRARYYMDMNRSGREEDYARYEKWIDLRARRIPLQHIIGRAPFMNYEFEVNEHVLNPRADTEVLVEQALEAIKRRKTGLIPGSGADGAWNGDTVRVLDMCTGSGCIAISLFCMAKEAGIPCEVTAVDLSEDALAVASRNNQRLCAGGVKLIHSDLFEALSDSLEFDIIVSNPPYIKSEEIEDLMPEVKDHEPRMALDGTEDGLYFYRKLAEESRNFLRAGGELLFEIGYDQGESVPEILMRNGYEQCRVIQDLAGLDRVVTAVKP